jgi:hypothetical protein
MKQDPRERSHSNGELCWRRFTQTVNAVGGFARRAAAVAVPFPQRSKNRARGFEKAPARDQDCSRGHCGSWWWFVEKARSMGHEVWLSHPKQTKAIAHARLKSDKVDAVMLARLLKADFLPTVWILRGKERYVRELLGRKGTGILPRKEAAWPDGFYCRRHWSIFEWPSNLLAAIILERARGGASKYPGGRNEKTCRRDVSPD